VLDWLGKAKTKTYTLSFREAVALSTVKGAMSGQSKAEQAVSAIQ
jgi:hypothetical protein